MVVRLSRKEKVTGSIPVAAFYSIFVQAEKKKTTTTTRRRKKEEKDNKKRKMLRFLKIF